MNATASVDRGGSKAWMAWWCCREKWAARGWSRPGSQARPWDQLPSEGLWLCTWRNSRASQSTVKAGLFREIHISKSECGSSQKAKGYGFLQVGQFHSLDFSGSAVLKNLPADAGDVGSFPGSRRSSGEEKAAHSSILTWETLWTEEPGGLQPMGSQWVGHDLAAKQHKTIQQFHRLMSGKIISAIWGKGWGSSRHWVTTYFLAFYGQPWNWHGTMGVSFSICRCITTSVYWGLWSAGSHIACHLGLSCFYQFMLCPSAMAVSFFSRLCLAPSRLRIDPPRGEFAAWMAVQNFPTRSHELGLIPLA